MYGTPTCPNRTEILKPTRSFPDTSRYAFPARQLRQVKAAQPYCSMSAVSVSRWDRGYPLIGVT